MRVQVWLDTSCFLNDLSDQICFFIGAQKFSFSTELKNKLMFACELITNGSNPLFERGTRLLIAKANVKPGRRLFRDKVARCVTDVDCCDFEIGGIKILA